MTADAVSEGAFINHDLEAKSQEEELNDSRLELYEPSFDENKNMLVLSSDYCACFCWTRPQLPQWMDMPISMPKEGGSQTGNRLRGLTYAQLLYILNLIACIVHLGFAIVVFVIAKSPVNVELWSPSARFNVPQLSDVLMGNATAQVLWQPYYYLKEDPFTISLRDLTLWFFVLSAMAHGFVVVTGCQLSIYYWWIDQCRQPLRYVLLQTVEHSSSCLLTRCVAWLGLRLHALTPPFCFCVYTRWLEYFWSSTLMMVALAIFCGIRTTHLLLSIAALNMLMITFGWVTEALSRPDFDSREVLSNGMLGRHKLWFLSGDIAGRRNLILACVPIACLPAAASLQRLGPFLLGCFPYSICWYILINVYIASTEEARDGGNFPAFVDIIVYGEVVIFSVFGVVMLFQQLTHAGCYNFYWGEVAYIILSLVAKILLGVVVATQVLIFDRFEDIFDISLNVTGVNLTGVTSWEELRNRLE